MGALYVRHELLRHELVRRYTFTDQPFYDPKILASMGFYCETSLKRLYCFSCNFSAPYKRLNDDLFAKHVHESKQCFFLQGGDVSIKMDISNLTIQGMEHVLIKDSLIPRIDEDLDFSYSLDFPDYISATRARRHCPLAEIYAPFLIPAVDDDRKIFNVENFFAYMRCELKRYETFSIRKFPLSESFAQKLAKNGFIYTLLNTSSQCAFCRIIIGEWKGNEDVEDVHKRYSPNCAFIKGKDVNNIAYLGSYEEEKIETIDLSGVASLDRLQCKICLDNEIDIIFFPCKHAVLCNNCSMNIHLKHCPICRGHIRKKFEFFLS